MRILHPRNDFVCCSAARTDSASHRKTDHCSYEWECMPLRDLSKNRRGSAARRKFHEQKDTGCIPSLIPNCDSTKRSHACGMALSSSGAISSSCWVEVWLWAWQAFTRRRKNPEPELNLGQKLQKLLIRGCTSVTPDRSPLSPAK